VRSLFVQGGGKGEWRKVSGPGEGGGAGGEGLRVTALR